jgi:hypothetical protein
MSSESRFISDGNNESELRHELLKLRKNRKVDVDTKSMNMASVIIAYGKRDDVDSMTKLVAHPYLSMLYSALGNFDLTLVCLEYIDDQWCIECGATYLASECLRCILGRVQAKDAKSIDFNRVITYQVKGELKYAGKQDSKSGPIAIPISWRRYVPSHPDDIAMVGSWCRYIVDARLTPRDHTSGFDTFIDCTPTNGDYMSHISYMHQPRDVVSMYRAEHTPGVPYLIFPEPFSTDDAIVSGTTITFHVHPFNLIAEKYNPMYKSPEISWDAY